jgi:hypothetical protein
MNNTLKIIVWITAAIAVVSLGTAAVLFFAGGMGGPWEAGSGIDIDERKTVPLSGIGVIEVNTSSTDVYVAASEGDTIDMRLRGTVYSGQADAVPTLTVGRA